uniref:Putative secreted protein n=1 Tax=Anopheles aquasalis TaxID=42839 RepID=T1DQU6_ANOAQ
MFRFLGVLGSFLIHAYCSSYVFLLASVCVAAHPNHQGMWLVHLASEYLKASQSYEIDSKVQCGMGRRDAMDIQTPQPLPAPQTKRRILRGFIG